MQIKIKNVHTANSVFKPNNFKDLILLWTIPS